MTSVEQLIGNLLLRHNCVIIPSFGGFVAKRVSARIDYDNGTMLPPGKSILFNRQLLNNDGLLVNEFARENQMSYDEAAREMDGTVLNWRNTLQEGGRIEIENVGNLYFDDERNICFEQDRFANLLLESFGLGSVHFVTEEDVKIVEQAVSLSAKEEHEHVVEKTPSNPASSLEKEPETPIVPIAEPQPVEKSEETKVPEPVIAPKRSNRAWKYVAAACILPIAFYSIWIPAKTDVLESGMVSFSDFNPFHQRTEGAYQPDKLEKEHSNTETTQKSLKEELDDVPSDVEVYSYKFTDDTYIKVALPKKESAETSNETRQSKSTVTPKTPTSGAFDANTMHYVVGCFGDETNANNLVAKLRANGLDAKIVDVKGGLHRVSAGGAISEEAYQTIKLKADAMGLSGWRLR